MEQTPYYPMGHQPDTGATESDWTEAIGLMLDAGSIGTVEAICRLPDVLCWAEYAGADAE